MGTRHLTIIKHEGQIKLANYGQWDGYPSGQGRNIIEYLRGEAVPKTDFKGTVQEEIPAVQYNREMLIDGLKHTREVTDDEMTAIFRGLGMEPDKEGSVWMNLDQAKEYHRKHAALSRDTGSDILKLVQKASFTHPLLVRSNLDFGKDSSCEYVWLMDLDADELQMYFQYPGFPVVATCSLSSPPTVEDFIKQFEEQEEMANGM
jgi:hypothetical protein